MKIPPYTVAAFLENEHLKQNGVLIYGPNYGLVSYYVKKIVEKYGKNTEWNSFRISYDICKNDTSQLSEWMQGRSLFDDASQKKLIVIGDVTPSMNASFRHILDSNKGNYFLLLYGQELPSSSPLRQYFEKSSTMGALACYKEEGEALYKTIDMLLKKHQLVPASFDVMRALREYCHELDYGSLQNEFEKLSLYMNNRKKVEYVDITASFTCSSESNTESFCLAVFDNDEKNIVMLKEKLYLSGISPITLLRALLRYITRLLIVKGLIEERQKTEKDAFSALKPPLFFKNIPFFRRHLSLFKIPDYVTLIEKMNDAELKCKEGMENIHSIFNHIILEISVFTKEKGRKN